EPVEQMPQPAPCFPGLAAAEIQAVVAEVDARQDDLLAAARDERLDFRGDLVRGPAAHDGAHLRDDAVTAVEQTAVLHLDEGPAVAVEAGDAARQARDTEGAQLLREAGLVGYDLDDAGQPA